MSKILILMIIMLLIILPIFIGSIFLQIVLSKKKNKFLGLIFPLITFLMSFLILVIANWGYVSMSEVKTEAVTINSNGEVISSKVVENGNINHLNSSIIFTSIWLTIFFNIPTIIYLGIYFGYSKYRKELAHKSHDELIKMNIQDLE